MTRAAIGVGACKFGDGAKSRIELATADSQQRPQTALKKPRVTGVSHVEPGSRWGRQSMLWCHQSVLTAPVRRKAGVCDLKHTWRWRLICSHALISVMPLLSGLRSVHMQAGAEGHREVSHQELGVT
jgi:hypothetical protein